MKPRRPDRDRDIFTLLNALKGVKSADIARRSFLSAQTITRLRRGVTRWPRHTTLAELARIAGMRFTLTEGYLPRSVAVISKEKIAGSLQLQKETTSDQIQIRRVLAGTHTGAV